MKNIVTMVVCSSILALAALTGCNAERGQSIPAGTTFQAQLGADTKPEAKTGTQALPTPRPTCNCAPPAHGGTSLLCTCK
jgi:hypothetical protein